jgi:hypothetical protein
MNDTASALQPAIIAVVAQMRRYVTWGKITPSTPRIVNAAAKQSERSASSEHRPADSSEAYVYIAIHFARRAVGVMPTSILDHDGSAIDYDAEVDRASRADSPTFSQIQG